VRALTPDNHLSHYEDTLTVGRYQVFFARVLWYLVF
jgi:hypothetical protein